MYHRNKKAGLPYKERPAFYRYGEIFQSRILKEIHHVPHRSIQSDQHGAGDDRVTDVVLLNSTKGRYGFDVDVVEPVPGIDPQTNFTRKFDGCINLLQLLLLLGPCVRFGVGTGVDFNIIGTGLF